MSPESSLNAFHFWHNKENEDLNMYDSLFELIVLVLTRVSNIYEAIVIFGLKTLK